MFSVHGYNGEGMKPKTLCLTYDDGPGPWTVEIAEFLHSHGIRASFFILGKFAVERREILTRLKDLNHIVGNHTYDHPDIPYYCSVDGNLQDQIMRTDAVIGEFITTERIYFRAPYGKWSDEAAKHLNTNLQSSLRYTGPIHWDIPGIDCYYWKIGKSVDDAVETYLKEIEEKQSGIMVMHDEIADMDTIRHLYKTLELTKKLIPILLDKGYQFVGLDEIESISSNAINNDEFAIQGKNKNYLQVSGDSVGMTGKQKTDTGCSWTLQKTNLGKVALRSSNGKYLHVNPSENEVAGLSIGEIGHYEQFDLVAVREDAFMLRTDNGNFFGGAKNASVLTASAPYMRQADILEFVPLYNEKKKRLTWKKKMELMKKRYLFIKSKLLQS